MSKMSIQIVAMVCVLLCLVESKDSSISHNNGAEPSECPSKESNMQVGICIDTCASDANCTGRDKCCSNGCGRVCMDLSPKPGACPKKDEVSNDCTEINQCTNDNECTGKQKCCCNGCGKVCTDPRGSACSEQKVYNKEPCIQCRCDKGDLMCLTYSCLACQPGYEPKLKEGQCCPDCQKVPEV